MDRNIIIIVFLLFVVTSCVTDDSAFTDSDRSASSEDSDERPNPNIIELTDEQVWQILQYNQDFNVLLGAMSPADIANIFVNISIINMTSEQGDIIIENFGGFFESREHSLDDSDDIERRRRSDGELISVCPTEDGTVAVGLAVDTSGELVQVIQLDSALQLFPISLCERQNGLVPLVECLSALTTRKAYVLVLTGYENVFAIRDICIPTCRAVTPLDG